MITARTRWSATWLMALAAVLPLARPLPAQTVSGVVAPEPSDTQDDRPAASRDATAARLEFKPLSQVQLDQVAKAKLLPPDVSDQAFVGQQMAAPMSSNMTDFRWEPTNFFHQPLYFDDTPLERYGQTICPTAQPVISATRFFLTVPLIPYKMGVDRPRDCVTSYGLYRPGDCAPCVREVLPRGEKDAVIFQTAATLGWVFILP